MIANKFPVKTILKTIYYVLVGRDVEVVGASQDVWDLLPPDLNSEACARALADLFRANLVLRPEVPAPFRHYSFSADPEDQMELYWMDFAGMVGASHGCLEGNYTWVFFRHRDRPHDHGHWLECRVGADGSLLRDHFRDLGREQALCRQAEQAFGLRPLESSVPEMPPPPEKRKRRRAPTRAEVELAARQPTKKEVARSVLDSVWPEPGERIPYAEFCDRLAKVGTDVLLNRRGASVGVSYAINGQVWKASTLGEAYQWASIEAHLMQDIDPRSAELAARTAPAAAPEVTSQERPQPTPPVASVASARPHPRPKSNPPHNLLKLLETAYEHPRTLFEREEKRRIREDFERAATSRRPGPPSPGGGSRLAPRGKRPRR